MSVSPAQPAGLDSVDGRTNVLLVASSLCIGGAETVIRHLAETIDRRRFDVSVCYMKDRGQVGDAIERAGVELLPATHTGRGAARYLSFRGLLEVVRAKRPRVLHTHTTEGLVDACICKLFVPSLRVVHTFHFGNYPHTRKSVIWMERVFSRFADRLFAVSEVQRRQIRAVHWLNEPATATIWNGVPLPGNERSAAAFRAQYGIRDHIVIGTIATLIEQKGLRDLLHTASVIRARFGDRCRFIVLGEGRLRAELEALRHELGLDDVVIFAGWVNDAAAVGLPAFDVFFQPSKWEAMSVVVLEAMAARKPVVATRVGENPHMIDDGSTGLLVQPGDVDGMAAALARVIEDDELRTRMGLAGRAKVERQFTVAHMTSSYEQVYQDVAR